MKKLTTNQLLIAGGVIALVWILYKRKKAKNGSQMINDAMNNGTSDGSISVSDGDKGTSEQDDPRISTGGVKAKSCKQAIAEFEKIKMTSRMTEEQLFKLRDKMLSGCTGVMPMPPKSYPTKPTLPPIKPNRGKGALIGITM